VKSDPPRVSSSNNVRQFSRYGWFLSHREHLHFQTQNGTYRPLSECSIICRWWSVLSVSELQEGRMDRLRELQSQEQSYRPKQDCGNYCDGLNLLTKILSYLMPQDLCHFEETSQRYLCSREAELIWKQFCWKRWYVQREIVSENSCLKSKDGKPSWKLTYKIWIHEMKIPHGRLMPMTQRVFGRNKGDGIDCWFYLRHSNDCLLTPASHSQGSQNNSKACLGSLRLCLQNTSLCPLQLFLQESFQIDLKSSPETGGPADQLLISLSELSAKNGLLIETIAPTTGLMTESVNLSYLEFAIITLQVICSEGVSNEVDLLSSIDRVRVVGWRASHPLHRGSEKEGVDEITSCERCSSSISRVEVSVDDEELIWRAYETAPGGVILLREATLLRGRA
jgi:hypothetical protein